MLGVLLDISAVSTVQLLLPLLLFLPALMALALSWLIGGSTWVGKWRFLNKNVKILTDYLLEGSLCV